MQRRPSYDDSNNLDEFSHVVLYDDLPDGDVAANLQDNGGPATAALRERELMLREKELRLRQQEMAMRSRGGGRRPPPNRHQEFDEDEDDDDYFDPMQARGAADAAHRSRQFRHDECDLQAHETNDQPKPTSK